MSNWQSSAKCAGINTSVFFFDLEDPEPVKHQKVIEAKKICATCTVQLECLEQNRYERFGIFGGLGPKERMNSEAPQGYKPCKSCGIPFKQENTSHLYCDSNCKKVARQLKRREDAKVS
jgi:WhiB family redox-sensing transcriptional regulator